MERLASELPASRPLVVGDDASGSKQGFLASSLFLSMTMFVMFGPYPQIFSGVDTTATGEVAEKSYLLVTKLLLLSLCLSNIRNIGKQLDLQKLWPLYVFLGIIFMTCAFSDDLYGSLRACLEMTIVFGFSVIVSSIKTPRQGLTIVYGALSLALLFSYINVFLFPSWGVHQATDALQSVHAGRWRGVFAHKNLLAQIAALHFMLTIVSREILFRKRSRQRLFLAFSGLALIFAGSATALVAVTFTLLIWRMTFVPFHFRIFLYGFVASLVLMIVLLANEPGQAFFDITGRDATLTGRTLIWDWVMQNQFHNWVLGRGYMNINGLSLDLQRAFGPVIADVHNAYLEWILTTGIAGIAVLGLLILVVWKRTNPIQMAASISSGFGMIIATWLIGAFSEVSPFRPGNALFVCTAAAICFLLRQGEREHSAGV